VNESTQEELSFVPNPSNGKLVMALPAGTFNITVSADGYAGQTDKITVSDLGLPIAEEKKNYHLKKQ
jgi:hypothetical protein